MKKLKGYLCLLLALLLAGAACLAEAPALKKQIAAAEEAVENWFAGGGAVAREDVERAAAYLRERAGELEKPLDQVDEEVAARLAQAVTYLEQAAARACASVENAAVRLAVPMRTGIEQLRKAGQGWAEAGMDDYKAAFASASAEFEANAQACLDELCASDESLREKLILAETEVINWFDAAGAVAREDVERAAAYLREHAGELEKPLDQVDEEVAARLAQAVTYLEQAAAQGLEEAKGALADAVAQVRRGVERLWKEGQSWAEAGMDQVKAAYESARAELEAGWDALIASAGERFE